jgi:esterase/lipase
LYNGRAFSSNQAQQFVIQYQSSIAQTSYEYFQEKGDNSESSGFKAALLKGSDGEYILTIAGTDPDLGDLFSDINLIQEKIVAQFEYLVEYVNYVKSIIPEGQQITVSGHSLGGALAQMATATFPDLIKQTYTYNSPGAKNLDIPEIYEENGVYFRKDYENIFGVEKLVTTEITKDLYDAYNFYKNNNSLENVNQKVINIRGEDAFGAGITELGEDIGSDGIEFFINTDNALVNVPAHSVSTLEKSLYFYATLMTIDSSLDSETITQEMAKFKNNYTNSTNITSNDLTIFDNYLNRISDLFNNEISYEKNRGQVMNFHF